ncbi:hypothetical protein FZC79_00335 [Rossellomorea vietnamensis]|uniref:Uncharacterized protein n=2 Tax=Rossellomorea TaxID=2837508 RepID=A0A5D4KK70_9BACI|nr:MULTISPECIES: hypothetical protein [Rossellomorea]TYR77306.1 hypothetical protein FZC79_00335 [Rossellomorea vietnamensis]TYS78142.1 hypothetical protein FZC80_12985 [Rossellomorea aquimaris]
MSDQNRQNQKDTITNNIKDGAGALFHATHKALEATENAAMGAVDTTSKALKNVTGNNDRNE